MSKFIGTPLIYEGDRVELTSGHPWRGTVTHKDYGDGSGWSLWVMWDERFPEDGPFAERDLQLVRRRNDAPRRGPGI